MQLVAEAVSFSFGDHEIVDELAFCLGVGQSTAIVGPSGIGKTTVLALLGGLLRPQAGDVYVQSGDHLRASRDCVSWVLQTVNVFNDRSVLDNVAVGALADRTKRAEAEELARKALSRVGLETRSTEPVRRLSGGEMQRVVIARALASARPYVLADEPTGQLDARTTQRVLDALLATTESRGLLIVTHDPAVARRCDRTLTVSDGRLVDA